MRNVTISLDEETARWARVRAAEADTSVSRLVGDLLRGHMLDAETYEQAGRSYRGRSGARLRHANEALPDRASLHDR